MNCSHCLQDGVFVLSCFVSLIQLEESEDQYVQAERRYNSVKIVLDEKEKELGTASLKLQEALSTSAAHNNTIKQLEEAVQRYAPTSTHTFGIEGSGNIFYLLLHISK